MALTVGDFVASDTRALLKGDPDRAAIVRQTSGELYRMTLEEH
jgi:hypothetical protein